MTPIVILLVLAMIVLAGLSMRRHPFLFYVWLVIGFVLIRCFL